MVAWLVIVRTGRAELVCGLDKLVDRAAILAIIEYSRLLLRTYSCKLRGPAAFRSTQQPESSKFKENSVFKFCLLVVATFTRVWPFCSYYEPHTYTAAGSYYGKTILWSSLHQLQCQLLYHLFLSQTADPPLSKATKVARLQLAYKPGSSSFAECFELRWRVTGSRK